MFNFFAKEKPENDYFIISGNDYNHIKNVIRLKENDKILVSFNGESRLCVIEAFDSDIAKARICDQERYCAELPVEIHLFQGLPKGDKMELIIQKCTELGISEITPVEMNRCVVKLDEKKKKSKTERWQAIAESAAKQSKRSVIPKVNSTVKVRQMPDIISSFDLFLIPYENKDGMKSTSNALSQIKKGTKIGILIGPEGGFDESEIENLKLSEAKIISLGKRILRTETAAITSVAMCMLYCETKFEGDLI